VQQIHARETGADDHDIGFTWGGRACLRGIRHEVILAQREIVTSG
jgi:hypothetical protein